LLRNEGYLGKLIWGRVNYDRQPGTNRMVRREQPRNEWKVFEAPELQIISDELWEKVRERERVVRAELKNGNLVRGRLPGYQSKHLFSGFMKCGTCGGGIAVVSAGRAAGPRYGCRRAKREYTCDNAIEMKLSTLEERLLEKLQAELQRREIIDYVIREITRRAQQAPTGVKKPEALAKQLEGERRKLQNLVRALEDGEPSTTVLAAIRKREEGIKVLEGQLVAIQPAAASKRRTR
jgi:site-specific DNA recombinase